MVARWETRKTLDNIKMDIREIECDIMGRTEHAQHIPVVFIQTFMNF
jgi:hypothetical protein